MRYWIILDGLVAQSESLGDLLVDLSLDDQSQILISGGAGTGKSSIAGHFVAEAGGRRERSQYVALEESQSEIVRNMKSIGIQLAPLLARDMLCFHVSRPTAQGLEMPSALSSDGTPVLTISLEAR